MEREAFNLGFAALVSAFPSQGDKMTPENMLVYWGQLKVLPAELWNQGVSKCLDNCTFFPSIHELGEASVGEVFEKRPYNAHIYREPKKLEWRAALNRLALEGPQTRTSQAPRIETGKKGLP